VDTVLARSLATLVALSARVAAADTASPNPPAKPPDAAVEPPPESGREVGLFPLIGGDTDNGFGLGAIGSIAVFDKDNPVYLWKLDFSGFYATKHFPPSPSYIDAAARLTLPQLLDDRLRLELRPSFTLDEALPFYGLGNKPTVPTTTVRSRDFYERLHPSMFALRGGACRSTGTCSARCARRTTRSRPARSARSRRRSAPPIRT